MALLAECVPEYDRARVEREVIEFQQFDALSDLALGLARGNPQFRRLQPVTEKLRLVGAFEAATARS
jgi:hypothetical protein